MTHTPTPLVPVIIDVTKATIAKYPGMHVVINTAGDVVALCPLADTPVCDGQLSYAPAIQHAVNSLPALVKALEDITNVSAGGPYLSATDAFEGALQALYRCRDIARAALASHKTGG